MISHGFLGNLVRVIGRYQSYAQAHAHLLAAFLEGVVDRDLCLGLRITLGGGGSTSQISQETLGNHENP